MSFIFVSIFFIFGLIIGSFLNVVILRYNTQKSLGGRSACMSCYTTLAWYELIPVFSFLALMGRCRSCKTKIAAQYPLVELASGVIFTLLFMKFQHLLFDTPHVFAVMFLYYAFIFSLLLIITVYDLKHKIIPDIFSFIFGVLAFGGMFFFSRFDTSLLYWHIPDALDLLSGVLVAMPFFILWVVSGGAWMGFGDVKLAVGIGWLLGISVALSALALSFWSGAIIGILLILISKKYKMKSQIPFAPYLVLGTFVAFIFNLQIFTSF